MFYFIFFATSYLVTAEVTTVFKENLTCVMTGDSSNLPVYIDPPILADFSKLSVEIDNWVIDDWTTINSADARAAAVTDKRWEDFQMLQGDVGYALENNTLSFSVCISNKITFSIYSFNFAKDSLLDFTPKNVNFLSKTNSCLWYHYTVIKEKTGIRLISDKGSPQVFDLGYEPFWFYFKNPSGENLFWKLHDYDFKVATTVTEKEKSFVSVPPTKNLCLSMYVSVDKGYFLEIKLETDESSVSRTIMGINEKDGLKQWQKIEISSGTSGKANLSFFRGRMDQESGDGYWAIDKITFCNEDLEVYHVSLQDEKSKKHICKIFSEKDNPNQPIRRNSLSCEKPGFLGENCSISCEDVLGPSYPYCERHKICQDETSCFCSWGYQGPSCDRPCKNNTWGLFCKNTCDPECNQKCHPSTGECLKPQFALARRFGPLKNGNPSRGKPADYLPENITLISSTVNITFPDLEGGKDENIIYTIQYFCVNSLCDNQVVHEDEFTRSLNSKFEIRQYENFPPMAEYRANVTVKTLTYIFEKSYTLFRKIQNDSLVIKNMSIYSSSSSSLSLRFGAPGQNGLSFKIWYYETGSEESAESISAKSRCEIWDDFVCVKIENLKEETSYSVTVDTYDAKSQIWGLSQPISGFTEEKGPEAPEHVTVTASSNNEVVLEWTHPWIPNGVIQKFSVHSENENSSTTYIADVSRSQKMYHYKFPVKYNSLYNISVRGWNKFEGKTTEIQAMFFPMTAKFSEKQLNKDTMYICSKTCRLLIPKQENLDSIYKIVGLPGIESEDNVIAYFKTTKNKTSKTDNWYIFENVNQKEDYLLTDVDRDADNVLFDTKFSLYLVIIDARNDSVAVYPIRMSDSKKIEMDKIVAALTSNSSLIVILAIVLFLLLLLSLALPTKIRSLRLRLRNTKTGDYQDVPLEEEKPRSTYSHSEKFTEIKRKFLEDYLKKSLVTGRDLLDQFRSLGEATMPAVHAYQLKNKNKNKNLQNVPYDYNRVVLDEMDGLGTDDYINASYIDGLDRPKTYIASQGPKYYTIKDFWRMIWQEQVETIVMAANFIENKKRKCAEYFPQSVDAIFQCGDMAIELTSEQIYEYYIFRTLEVHYRQVTRTIYHFQLRWTPDDLTPLYPNYVVPLVKRLSFIRENSTTPIVYHCSAGVKRTGTLILCDLALHMARKNDTVDFYSLTKKLKDQRPHMVSSENQYILAHLVVLECLMEEEDTFKKSLRDNFNISTVKNQLNYLERLSWHDTTFQKEPNECAQNVHTVDGYQTQKKYMVTRQPTEETLGNFWKMVIKEQICFVIFLNNESYQSWVYHNQHHNRFISVKEVFLKKTTYCSFTKLLLRVFQLPEKNIIFEQEVYLLQAHGANNVDTLLNIIDDTNKICKELKPILVACHDGITASGIFITLDYLIEKCKNELEVDVCNVVRNIRRSGIPFIRTSDEMLFVYEAVLEYLQKFDDYNFIL